MLYAGTDLESCISTQVYENKSRSPDPAPPRGVFERLCEAVIGGARR